jgi:hypothetical protein
MRTNAAEAGGVGHASACKCVPLLIVVLEARSLPDFEDTFGGHEWALGG